MHVGAKRQFSPMLQPLERAAFFAIVLWPLLEADCPVLRAVLSQPLLSFLYIRFSLQPLCNQQQQGRSVSG